jgi:hypothetical protein
MSFDSRSNVTSESITAAANVVLDMDLAGRLD